MGDQTLAKAMNVQIETVHAGTAGRIAGLLRAAQPVTVVLEGTKGSGKTTLAAGIGRALGEGFVVHTVRGTAPGRSLTLFAIEHLLTHGEGSVVDVADNLPALLNRLTSTVLAQSAGALPVLWVDNLELLDPQSAALLGMLAGARSMRILATCRSLDEVGAFKSLKAEGLVECVPVPALTPKQSHQVLESRLERPVTSALAGSLHAFAGGNPLMLRLLADHARENGMLYREQHAWNLSGHLIESMTAGSLSAGMRILASDLTPSELNAAEILAAAGHVQIRHLTEFTDGAVLEGMCSRGLVTLARGGARETEASLTSEALGHIIRQTMPRSRAREIWAQTVLGVGTESEPVARPAAGQLLWAARLDLGVTDAQLTTSAEEALFAATPGVAERLLGHVAVETAAVLRLHAEARYLLGDRQRAAKLAESAASKATADDDAGSHALAAVGLLLGIESEASAVDLDGNGGFAALKAMIGFMDSGCFRQVIETYDEAGFDTGTGAGTGSGAASAIGARGVAGVDASVGTGAAAGTGAGAGTEAGTGTGTGTGAAAVEIPWFAGVLCAEACAVVGEQQRASAMIEEALAVQGGVRSAVLAGRALTAWCRILFLAGHWETCRQVLQAERRMRPARMLHSDGELEALEVIVTERSGGTAGPLPPIGSGLDGFGSFISAAAQAAGAATANPASAAKIHRTLQEQHWIAEESGPQLYIAGTIVLHRMLTGTESGDGYFGVPEPDLKHLQRLAETNEEHLAARYGALAAGLLTADAATLLEAARLGSAAGDELLAGKAAAAAASLAGRNHDAGVMRQARDLIADPGLPTMFGPGLLDQLTGREREVAMLVVSGSSNADVGARLGISKRTAERHLQNAYDKLGVSRRAELAGAMEAELVGVSRT